MTSELEATIELVRACGRAVKDADRTHLHVDAKDGKANFVTDWDRRIQERLREGLGTIAPDALFVGEEGAGAAFSPTGRYFIVDPIDGTTNFIRDFHASSISVALVADGAATLGVVYNPYLDEMFYARRGHGAFCNGKILGVSSVPLENALVIFGTSPYDETLAERSFALAYAYFRKAADVRRTGSAALDLCAVAAGRADLFFELSLAPWDYAAGALIVEEAGGVVTDLDGNALGYGRKTSLLARNKAVQPLRDARAVDSRTTSGAET
ncbi:MAG: inositol monophosphatase [Kiritimatiellae bacterium]|nr:inositol monophosphatase [Kiritimatiellia bacterium]